MFGNAFNYLTTSYNKSEFYLDEIICVTNIKFNIENPLRESNNGDDTYRKVYGFPIIIIKFTLKLIGYFIPKISGFYEFSLKNTESAALVCFANPSTFEYFHASKIPANLSDMSINVMFHFLKKILVHTRLHLK